MNNKINDKLRVLYEEYKKNLPAKVSAIETHWQELTANWEPERLRDFHREVHSLCGSAAIYGYDALSKAARELETYLRNLDEEAPQTPEMTADINAFVSKLPAYVENATTAKAPVLPEFTELPKVVNVDANKLIYIIDADTAFVAQFSQVLALAGYKVMSFPDITAFKKKPEQEGNAIAMLADVENLNKADISYLIKVRKNQQFIMPLYCVSNSTDLVTRLKAIRCGSSAFLPKPLEQFHLLKLLDKSLESTKAESYRILIIDDSASLAEYYSLILQQAGMITEMLTHPLLLMETLAEFQPDLLLMDIYMPDCSGLELAAVLRQEPLYTKLPIIFLSTEDDRIKQLAAMSIGGDDFLTKPILPQHLVAAVRSRAKRAGALSSFIIRDSLTELLNHNTILQELEAELSRAERQSTPLSFVLLDIDHFKEINDTYGHQMGDYVLRKLSELLLSQVRKDDRVGRYGGEEFALVLSGADATASKRICEGIREKFAGLQFKSGETEFHVTFSAGIVTYPAVKGVEVIIAAADKALYTAKHFGRNKVVHVDDK